MATTLQMVQFPQISAEYSKNLLPLAANFEGEITYAITAGDGGDSIVENSTLESFAGRKSLRVFSDTAFSLNFNGGAAFNHTVTEETPLFMALAIKHGNLAGDDPSLQVQVFTNGAHTETMVASIFYEEPHIGVWNISAGQIPAKEIGDVLSFAFEFISGNEDSEIFIDRWKLEYDNANQGLPTRYDLVEFEVPTNNGVYLLNITDGTATFANADISASATLDFGSIASHDFEDLTIALTGVVLGDTIDLGIPEASMVDHVNYIPFVSDVDEVTVRCQNVGGGSVNPASGVFTVSKKILY